MSRNRTISGLYIAALILVMATAGIVSAGQDEKAMVGTLSATMDRQSSTVTAMFVGYCEGEPVIIGPSTWAITGEEFSEASPEVIGNRLCGKDNSVKKVTKATNTGKDMVAEIVIVGPSSSILVGR
jgi:hypothetical protein